MISEYRIQSTEYRNKKTTRNSGMKKLLIKIQIEFGLNMALSIMKKKGPAPSSLKNGQKK